MLPHSTIDMSYLECHGVSMPRRSPIPPISPATGRFYERGNYAPVPGRTDSESLTVEGLYPAGIGRLVSAKWPEPAGGLRSLVHRRRHAAASGIEGVAKWVPQSLGAHRQLHRPVPAVQPGREPQPAGRQSPTLTSSITPGRRWRSSKSSLPYGDDRVGNGGLLRLRRQARRRHDGAPKICPTTGELHFFGYGSIFAARHLSSGHRRRRADDQPSD